MLEHPDGRIAGIEVKATGTPRAADLRGLQFLADPLGDRFHFGAVLTAAPEDDALRAPPGGATDQLPVGYRVRVFARVLAFTADNAEELRAALLAAAATVDAA